VLHDAAPDPTSSGFASHSRPRSIAFQ
jgi:hypothetical protein